MRIVFSPSMGRPGYVLLQAVMGGDVPPKVFNDFFPVETWLVAPTDDMAAYPIDETYTLVLLSRNATMDRSGRRTISSADPAPLAWEPAKRA